MRVRRSMLNFGTSVLFLVVTMAVALKAAPLLLRALREQGVGAFRVIFDGYGYVTILEFGLSGALGPLFVQALSAGDERAVRRTAAAGMRAYFKVAIGSVLVGLAATPFVHRFAADLNDPAMIADMRRAWMLGLLSFFSLVLSPMRSLIDARQRGYVINLMLTAQAVWITGLSVVLAQAGYGVTGQSVAHLTGIWMFSLAMTAVALRAHPGLLRGAITEPVDPDTRRALRGLSGPTLLFGICGRVGFLTDYLVVGSILGTKQVTSLLNTQRLVSLGQTVLQSIGNASWAALAELHARDERALFNQRLIEMTRLVAMLGAVGFVPVVAFNRAFTALWLADAPFTYGGDLVVVVAAVNAILLAEHSLWAWCFAASGKIRELIPLSIVAAAVNLTASVFLARRIGIVGPLLGTTLGFAVVGFWLLVWRLNRSFGTPVVPLLRAVAWPSAIGAAAAAGLWWLTLGHEPTGWFNLAAAMVASALAMFALAVGLLMTPEDRALWRHRLADLPIWKRIARADGVAR